MDRVTLGDGVQWLMLMSKQDPESVDCATPTSDNLQNSEMTPGSSSEDEGWFSAIGSDFKNIATCFRNNIPPVIGGVATLVHQTAMSVAAEIAELEREGFGDEDCAPDEDPDSIFLPWETRASNDNDTTILLYDTDEKLMGDILALSRNEKTFLEPFSSSSAEDEVNASAKMEFVLDESRISLIRRLLDIDENLAAMHARMSGVFGPFFCSLFVLFRAITLCSYFLPGRSDIRETLFWKNYFFHCEELRATRKIVEGFLTDTVDLGGELPSSVDVNFGKKELSSSDLDDSSLVAASANDELSYVNVIPSAPNSLNTFMSTKSVEDMVLVRVGHEIQMTK